MKDDRPSSVAVGSFNTHTNRVNDSYNDNSMKNITDNRHFGDKIGTINHQPTFLNVRGLDILRQNAVPGAAYNASECRSTPVCPRTRTVVLERVEKWVDARDDSAICWMHGPGGVGKTTLATTIAMKYAEEKRLAGSFFFSRDPANDAGRRSVHKIFATIAYQISTSHPTAKKKLRAVLDQNPLILNNSLEHQLSHLIIAPFQPFRFGPRVFVTLGVFFEVLRFFIACIIFHPYLNDLMRSSFVITMAVYSSITNHPTVQHALREQIKTLNHRLPMIVVIDALDECSKDVVALIKALALVYRDSPPPVRFFLTSRPEDHIRGKFRIPAYSQRTHFIDLMDFQAHDDIRIFLQDGFSSLYTELEDYMGGVGTQWPSEDELETLVEKSEGLFIYASTLLNYVSDVEDMGNGLSRELLKKSLPQERLKKAIKQHDGLDGLYRQVLGDAPFRSDPNFDVLLGAMCFLYDPLVMDDLTDLLQFKSTDETRLLLRGCRSILRIPESDKDEISFFHASLRDFLIDITRARVENFLDPVIQHVRLLDHCIRAITTNVVALNQDIKPSVLYAGKHWYRHMHAALQSSNAVHLLKAHFGERFETGLVHFLQSIMLESSNLCDAWEGVLQKQTISWTEIAKCSVMLDDMLLQDTTPLFPLISSIQKMVKFLGRHPTFHWRTARAIFDEITDNLNITFFGVDETQLDLKQLLTRLTPNKPLTSRVKNPFAKRDGESNCEPSDDSENEKSSDEPEHPIPIDTRRLVIYTGTDNVRKKLRSTVEIVFTLTPVKLAPSQSCTTLVWRALHFGRTSAIRTFLTWHDESGFCDLLKENDNTLNPSNPSLVVKPSQLMVLQDIKCKPDVSRWIMKHALKPTDIGIANMLPSTQHLALFSVDVSRTGTYSPVIDFGSIESNGIILCGRPVMLQAYVAHGYAERQPFDTSNARPLFIDSTGRPDPIDIRTLPSGTAFRLYSQNTGKIALEKD